MIRKLKQMMSVKGVLKKKIKNTIGSMKKKKHLISEPKVDSYTKLDADDVDNTNLKLSIKSDNISFETNVVDKNVSTNSTKRKKKERKSSNTNDDIEPPVKKKKVTFAADVEVDEKSTAGKMTRVSLNKKKKLNYIKKLKEKKKKQKNAKKSQEIAAVNSISRQERAIEYLMQWKNDRSNWKFKKIFQLWLIKHTYDSVMIPKENFNILVEYLQTIEGKSRNIILQTASNIVTEFSTSNDEEEELNSSQTNKYQRARTIIQMFG